MISESVEVEKRWPSRSMWARISTALTTLPLWASASSPSAPLSSNGCALRGWLEPVVE